MIQFTTKLYDVNSWLVAHLPKEASAKLPSRGQVMVQGAVNGYKIHTALEPDGDGGHWLHVDKTLQKAIKAGAGDAVRAEIAVTKDWPEPEIPKDVMAAIKADGDVFGQWQDITPMARWEWLRWINSTNSAETRKRRIEVSCSKLVSGWRRPCCFNRNMCCVPQVSKSGVLLTPETLKK